MDAPWDPATHSGPCPVCGETAAARVTPRGGWWVRCPGCGLTGSAVEFYKAAAAVTRTEAARACAAACGRKPPAARVVAAAYAVDRLRRVWTHLAARRKEYTLAAADLHRQMGCNPVRVGCWRTGAAGDLARLVAAARAAGLAAAARRARRVGPVAILVPAYDLPDRVVGGWAVRPDQEAWLGCRPAAGFPAAWAGPGTVVLTYSVVAAVRAAAAADPLPPPAVPVAGHPDAVAAFVRLWGRSAVAVWGAATPALVRLARAVGGGVVPPDRPPLAREARPWADAAAAFLAHVQSEARVGAYLDAAGEGAWREAVDRWPPRLSALARRAQAAKPRVVRAGSEVLVECETHWVCGRTGRLALGCRPEVRDVTVEDGQVYYAGVVRVRGLDVRFRAQSAAFRADPVGEIERACLEGGARRPVVGPAATPPAVLAAAFARYDEGG